MARIELSLAKILYFCNVKKSNATRSRCQEQRFSCLQFKEKYYPNDGGSSNAHKGSALDTLTHRIGVFICQKFNVMRKVKVTQQDSLLQAANCIQVSTLIEKGGEA